MSIVTKSALVLRGQDLLARLTEQAVCSVNLTIPFRDYQTARALEPFAPSPDARFRAMKELTAAGIAVNIGITPLIPSLNDSHIPELLGRARDNGATGAWMSLLRLPGSAAPYFIESLRERLPTKASRIIKHIEEERGGKLNSSEFGQRMKGTSQQWMMIEKLFKLYCHKLGFDREEGAAQVDCNPFRRPLSQGSLFE